MKPLLIGQAPGPKTDPKWPLAPLPRNSAGGRLADLAGLSPQRYLNAFDRTNLLHEFPGRWPGKNDDKWPKDLAKVAAQAIMPLLRGRTVVLVGRNVERAFGFDFKFHEWYRCMSWGFDVAVVPHTSGRNTWYRKPGNEAEARAFWAELTSRPGL